MNHSRSDAFGRRDLLAAAGAVAGGLLVTPPSPGKQRPTAKDATSFRYCLNMSTIRGQELTVEQEIDVAGKAGYDAIEPWLRKLHQRVQSGGSPKDLRTRLEDYGMTVESAIGFAKWIVDDDSERAAGFDEARRDMDLLAELGAKRIAAPPAGVVRESRVELPRAAERYRRLLELGDQTGVTPQVEVWGGNTSIGRLSEAIYVAIESGHPKACFLGDVYHLYKGGSDFRSLKLLSPETLQVFHFNDYPADPPRDTIRDEHRVYPGDGIAPIAEIVRGFVAVGARPVLSLELFNRSYWERDALDVARTGLQKMKDCVAAALA